MSNEQTDEQRLAILRERYCMPNSDMYILLRVLDARDARIKETRETLESMAEYTNYPIAPEDAFEQAMNSIQKLLASLTP